MFEKIDMCEYKDIPKSILKGFICRIISESSLPTKKEIVALIRTGDIPLENAMAEFLNKDTNMKRLGSLCEKWKNKYRIIRQDCYGEDFEEFTLLSYPTSSKSVQPNIDPRLYCVVRSDKDGKPYLISVYDNERRMQIIEYLQKTKGYTGSSIPREIKSITDAEKMGIVLVNGKPAKYDAEKEKKGKLREELRGELDEALEAQAKAHETERG